MEETEIGRRVRAELAPGEKALWSGQPRQGLFLVPMDGLYVPFTVFWFGFAVVWTVGASAGGVFFQLWGIMFVCIGVYLLVGRFFGDAAMRAATIYAVTDRRLLVIRTRWGASVSSTDLSGLGSLDLHARSSGRATILFGPTSSLPAVVLPGVPGGGRYQRRRFESISNGRAVHELIRKAVTDYQTGREPG